MISYRLNLDFKENTRLQLDALLKDTDAATRTEVIRRAISLYTVLVQYKKAGCEITLKQADGSEKNLVWL